MEVKAMVVGEDPSCSSSKDYEDLCDDEDTSVPIGEPIGPTQNQRSQATERLSASKFPSEMSIDLSDLHIDEGSSTKAAHGSSLSNGSDEPQSPISPRRSFDRRRRKSQEGDSKSSPSLNGSSNTFKFDEIPEDFFQQNNISDFTSFYTDSFRQDMQRHSLTTVEEQGDAESDEHSMTSNSLKNLSRRNSLNSSIGSVNRRRVKFEISTRLEDIQEFEKPDLEDYHMLYYTSHELQKMIDAKKEEERSSRNAVR